MCSCRDAVQFEPPRRLCRRANGSAAWQLVRVVRLRRHYEPGRARGLAISKEPYASSTGQPCFLSASATSRFVAAAILVNATAYGATSDGLGVRYGDPGFFVIVTLASARSLNICSIG
jgi:hypothetical protein